MKIGGGRVLEDKNTQPTSNIGSAQKKQGGASYPKDTVLPPSIYY